MKGYKNGKHDKGDNSMKKTEPQAPEPHVVEEVHLPDAVALRAFRAVLDPRHHPDRSAALAIWKRIAVTDLAATPLGTDEQQFIQTVAAKMIDADKLDAKKRPDAVLAASGLYGTHSNELETRMKQIREIFADFEELPATTQEPTTASKKYSKRNKSLAVYASDIELMRNFQDLDMLRKRVNKVKDNSRKK
jgi:hypothetical protein